MKQLPLIAVLLLGGCAEAQLVRTNEALAHAEGNKRGGVVRYPTQGAAYLIESLRRDADEKMATYCGGTYQIVRQWEEHGETYTEAIAPYTVVSDEVKYWSIEFQCP